MPTCCDCKEDLPRANFASSQFKKPASDRRCKQCAKAREPAQEDSTALVVTPASTTTVIAKNTPPRPAIDLKSLIATIISAYCNKRKGGFIVVNSSSQSALAIEFNGGNQNKVLLYFVESPDLQRAKIFLKGETFDALSVPTQVYSGLLKSLMKTCRPKGVTDFASGCAMYEGHLA